MHTNQNIWSRHSDIGDNRSLLSTLVFTDNAALSTVTLQITQLCCVVLQLGTPYQQLFNTYLHHHPLSAAISVLNYLAGHTELIYCSTFMIA